MKKHRRHFKESVLLSEMSTFPIKRSEIKKQRVINCLYLAMKSIR